jgi:hypothetical protein
LLVAGLWSLVAGCWLLVTGYWLLVAGHWLLVAGGSILVTGCWLLVTGCWSLVAGYWLAAAGGSMLEAGCWMLDDRTSWRRAHGSRRMVVGSRTPSADNKMVYGRGYKVGGNDLKVQIVDCRFKAKYLSIIFRHPASTFNNTPCAFSTLYLMP